MTRYAREVISWVAYGFVSAGLGALFVLWLFPPDDRR